MSEELQTVFEAVITVDKAMPQTIYWEKDSEKLCGDMEAERDAVPFQSPSLSILIEQMK
jgi:hypothetical protein